MSTCKFIHLGHLALGNLTTVLATDAFASGMDMKHDLSGLFLVHLEKALQNVHHKLHWGKIIIQQDHPVAWWLLKLRRGRLHLFILVVLRPLIMVCQGLYSDSSNFSKIYRLQSTISNDTSPLFFIPVIILFNKPYGVLTQFRDQDGRPTLADYIPIPKIYPAGRLDRDSEGLLILTDDGKLQAKISHPRHKMEKRYWAQVEGIPDQSALTQLRTGITLKDGVTAPAKVCSIPPPEIWPRTPPIRVRKTVPDSWIELTIREGKNRQVRRMTAAAGHPTLRLIRVAIGPWRLQRLQPGEWVKVQSSV